MEPRARASRHKSSLNFPDELRTLLYGTGAPIHPDISHPLPDGSSEKYLSSVTSTNPNKTHPPTPYHSTTTSIAPPFPETLRVLDEIVTDFIIETCHAAVSVASYSGRTKLKLADFEWVMRRDRKKLGRVQEMFRRQAANKEARRIAGMGGGDEGVGGKMQVRDLQDLGDIVGEEGTGRGRGKGRGRRRKRVDIGPAGGGGIGGDADADDAGAHSRGQGKDPSANGPAGRPRSTLGDEEALDDVEVDIDNDLERADEDGDADRHRTKRARSGLD